MSSISYELNRIRDRVRVAEDTVDSLVNAVHLLVAELYNSAHWISRECRVGLAEADKQLSKYNYEGDRDIDTLFGAYSDLYRSGVDGHDRQGNTETVADGRGDR